MEENNMSIYICYSFDMPDFGAKDPYATTRRIASEQPGGNNRPHPVCG
jgi:hypothetical protein